jgi:hypothetical protein
MEQVDQDCLVAAKDKHQKNLENRDHVFKFSVLLLASDNRSIDNLDEHELDD